MNAIKKFFIIHLIMMVFVSPVVFTGFCYAGGPTPERLRPTDTSLLKKVETRYLELAKKYGEKFKDISQSLFIYIATIGTIIFGIQCCLNRPGLGEALASYLTTIAFGMFCWIAIYYFTTWSQNLFNIQADMVVYAAGENRDIVLNTIEFNFYGQLWAIKNVVFTAIQKSGWDEIAISLGLFLLLILIFVITGFIYARLLVIKCEAYISLCLAVLIMAFGGSSYTKDYAINTMRFAVSLAFKLMTMEVILLIGVTMIRDISSAIIKTKPEQLNTLQESLIALVICLVILFVIAQSLPETIAGVINGSHSGSGAGLKQAASTFAAPMMAAGAAAGAAAMHAAAIGAGVIKSGIDRDKESSMSKLADAVGVGSQPSGRSGASEINDGSQQRDAAQQLGGNPFSGADGTPTYTGSNLKGPDISDAGQPGGTGADGQPGSTGQDGGTGQPGGTGQDGGAGMDGIIGASGQRGDIGGAGADGQPGGTGQGGGAGEVDTGDGSTPNKGEVDTGGVAGNEVNTQNDTSTSSAPDTAASLNESPKDGGQEGVSKTPSAPGGSFASEKVPDKAFSEFKSGAQTRVPRSVRIAGYAAMALGRSYMEAKRQQWRNGNGGGSPLATMRMMRANIADSARDRSTNRQNETGTQERQETEATRHQQSMAAMQQNPAVMSSIEKLLNDRSPRA